MAIDEALLSALATEEREQRTGVREITTLLTEAWAISPGITDVSLSRMDSRTLVELAPHAGLADSADQSQMSSGEGPLLEAARTSWSVSHNIHHDPRWPRWRRRSAGLDLGSALSIRLSSPRETTVFSLNLYSTRPGCFTPAEILVVALLFAGHTARRLQSASVLPAVDESLHGIDTVAIATGVLMQRCHTDEDSALVELHRLSRAGGCSPQEEAGLIVGARAVGG